MKKRKGLRNIAFTLILLTDLAFNHLSCSRSGDQGDYTLPKIKMLTELGEIIIEVEVEKAPVTAANFLKYVDDNRFKDASFYRVVTLDNQPDDSIRIEVIQGGLGFGESELRLPPIKHESTEETGIFHQDGVISMARNSPGTASSEIFICIGDQPELDFGGRRNPDGYGFAAFGRVIRGMDVVLKIQNQPSEGQMLLSPIRIIDMSRMESEEIEKYVEEFYIRGLIKRDFQLIRTICIREARLMSAGRDGQLHITTLDRWSKRFDPDNPPFKSLEYEISRIDWKGTAAQVRIDFLVDGSRDVTDYLHLLKIEDKWRIVNIIDY